MSYDTSRDTITVNGIEYDVKREDDRGHPETTLTITTFNVEQDEFVDAFPGLSATLGYDEFDHDAFNPREWGNVGTMSVSYNRYNLGDEDITEIDFDVDCDKCDEYCQIPHPKNADETVDCDKCDGYGQITLDPAAYFKQKRGARVVIGLFVYEHSGITMSAGPRVGEVLTQSDVRSTGRFIGDDAGWDTSFVGFIYDTPEGIKECFGDNTVTDEQIEEALRGEVAVYASYLEGDITTYYVQDDETGFSDGCGGYVGNHKQCEQDCFEALESAIEKRLNEQIERAHWAARDTPTK